MLKRFANNSLRFRLIVILSGISLLIWFTATAIEWFKFREEMDKQFDTQQVLFAERLASSNIM
ncbi:two-component system sensor histidine kinase QseC, partial [Xanthomonas citri pv. citri]|nr:two-component system sensor histidine kinase QseC [Xanthomonas citri pv. citri]